MTQLSGVVGIWTHPLSFGKIKLNLFTIKINKNSEEIAMHT